MGSTPVRGVRLAASLLGSCLLAGVAGAQVPLGSTGGDEGLTLFVKPIAPTTAEMVLVVTGGTPGDVPIVALSATHRAPLDDLRTGTVRADELVFHFGEPFPDSGMVEVPVPRPNQGVSTPLYAQATGVQTWEPAGGGTSGPVVVTMIGGLSLALGDKLFCLENFIIDDPACSITNLGPNVGWMMEDSFGFAQTYSFKPGALYAQTFTGETGSITGELVSIANPTYGWRIQLFLNDRSNPGDPGYPPVGSPYFGFGPLKNCPFYLASNGGPIDPGSWFYWQGAQGTLSGRGGYFGALATLARFGSPFQVGLGANTANLQFGVGAWFDVRFVANPLSGQDPLPMTAPVNGELFGQTRPCPNGM